jgi:hypothetical protein
MPDFHATVNGTYGNGINWSFGANITSNQTGSGLLATWANAWASAWTAGGSGLDTLYPTTTEITGYRVAQFDPSWAQASAWTQNVAAPGVAVGDSLPYQEAVVVSLRGVTLGAKARGRFYMPALEETFVNNNQIVSTALSRLSGGVNLVKAAVTADGSTFFVYARPKKKPIVVPAGPKYVVNTFEVSNKPATQKRRTRKIKPTYL